MNELPVAVILGAGMGGRGVANALADMAHLVIVDRDQDFAQAAADPGHHCWGDSRGPRGRPH